jgi:hypothetical protein
MLIDVYKLLFYSNLCDPDQEVHAALQGLNSCQLRDSWLLVEMFDPTPQILYLFKVHINVNWLGSQVLFLALDIEELHQLR